ncbi:nuclear transport factor 2 family protein [Rothia koreensis]|uniref:nuclear transport factor 2 family protein n=1 Tax=Rothia koreensis TaxID=592378 RepID=UPI003FCD86CB
MADSIPEPVASFLAAVNAHRETAFDESFTADAVVDDWGKVLTGLDQIKDWSATEFIGSSPILDVTSVDIEDGTVAITGDWRSSHANGPSSFRFDLDGDRIAAMIIRAG